eukprot:jgi/Antlo1/1489/529
MFADAAYFLHRAQGARKNAVCTPPWRRRCARLRRKTACG